MRANELLLATSLISSSSNSSSPSAVSQPVRTKCKQLLNNERNYVSRVGKLNVRMAMMTMMMMMVMLGRCTVYGSLCRTECVRGLDLNYDRLKSVTLRAMVNAPVLDKTPAVLGHPPKVGPIRKERSRFSKPNQSQFPPTKSNTVDRLCRSRASAAVFRKMQNGSSSRHSTTRSRRWRFGCLASSANSLVGATEAYDGWVAVQCSAVHANCSRRLHSPGGGFYF
uniref:Putative secreted protein n=1 Tax=Anopheles marajoara TaxID=58244 RepID=A0A2M4C5U7_9DIPT